jgi:predicted RNase H-like HicB family nuclease
MIFSIEFEREDDGRWIAEIPSLPGVMAYGTTKQDAESKARAIANRIITAIAPKLRTIETS